MRAIVQNVNEMTLGWNNALRSLNVDSHLWNEQYKPSFDLFAEFSPELLIVHELTESLAKCILKYKPQVFLKVSDLKQTTQITWDLAQQIPVNLFTTHTPGNEQDVLHWYQLGKVKNCPPGFDSVRYKPAQPFDIDLGFIGDYTEEYEFINRATLDLRVRIFGRNWLCPECLGVCLQENENRIYSGPTVAFNMEQALKGLGCKGFTLIKKAPENLDIDTFETYEEMIDKIKKPRKQKFKIEEHTYVERMKGLLE